MFCPEKEQRKVSTILHYSFQNMFCLGPTHTHIYYIHTFGFGTVAANPPKLRSAMERGCITLFIIFLFVLCFPVSSDSQKLSPSISLHDQEQAHEVTIKNIKREEDKSIDIFRVGVGARGVTGGRGGGRKASPKRNAAIDHRPQLFFSTTSVLFTGLIMLSLTCQ
ncbi:uncharacterized protein LOC106367092 [Brassica napus]|uniref:uncharacterized protein LOC106367092 n=1 Tax=Brassica napus TaxID=3708 RepID=UPI0020786F32|nr:uncharacterized protein LOC106367092 [Brassica napus]